MSDSLVQIWYDHVCIPTLHIYLYMRFDIPSNLFSARGQMIPTPSKLKTNKSSFMASPERQSTFHVRTWGKPFGISQNIWDSSGIFSKSGPSDVGGAWAFCAQNVGEKSSKIVPKTFCHFLHFRVVSVTHTYLYTYKHIIFSRALSYTFQKTAWCCVPLC